MIHRSLLAKDSTMVNISVGSTAWQRWLRARGLSAILMLIACFSVQLIQAAPPITALAMTPDGQAYIVGSQTGAVVRDRVTHGKLKQLSTELVQVHDIKFSPDGSELLLVGGTPAEIGMVERWSWPKASKLTSLTIGTEVIYRACWSSDNHKFALAAGDSTCHIISREDMTRQTYTGHSQPVMAISFWNNDTQLLSAGIDQTLQLWSGDARQRQRGLNNHTDSLNDLAPQALGDIREESTYVASASDDSTVRLWQPNIGRMVRFARLESPARCVRWLQDGQQSDQLVVACDDGQVLFLDLNDMSIKLRLKSHIRPIYEMVIVSTEKELLVGGEGGIEVLSWR